MSKEEHRSSEMFIVVSVFSVFSMIMEQTGIDFQRRDPGIEDRNHKGIKGIKVRFVGRASYHISERKLLEIPRLAQCRTVCEVLQFFQLKVLAARV